MTTLIEYTANDTIIGDRSAYVAFVAEMNTDLQPLGMLEVSFAAELVRGLWRLRSLPVEVTDLEEAVKVSTARVRAGIQTTIRWAMTELRRIQTARLLRTGLQLGAEIGLADPKEIRRSTAKRQPSAAAVTPSALGGHAGRARRVDPQEVNRVEAEIEALLSRVPASVLTGSPTSRHATTKGA